MTGQKALRFGLLPPLAVVFVILFLIQIAIYSDLTVDVFWKTVLAAAIAGILSTILVNVYKSRTRIFREDSTGRLLHRITGGDLAVRTRDIDEQAGTREIALGIRAMVLNLERTISRFSQLSADVNLVSDQIGRRSRDLGRSAETQISSTGATAQSVTQI